MEMQKILQRKEELLELAELVLSNETLPESSRDILHAMIERLWNESGDLKEESTIHKSEYDLLIGALELSEQEADEEILSIHAEQEAIAQEIIQLNADTERLNAKKEKEGIDGLRKRLR